MDKTWQALATEAGIAAEHIGIGVTALGRANYAHKAYYGQAFFALSIGFERAAKLALVIDHALTNNRTFPDSAVLRGYGHRIDKLFEQLDVIAVRRGLSGGDRLPRTPIHAGIITVLSDFASNITRYYNLDFVTGDPRAAVRVDPIQAWYDMVTVPVLALHYTSRAREKHRRNAEIIDALIGAHSMVRFHSERGEEMNTVLEASERTGTTDFAKPFVRMYVLQIARFISHVMTELTFDAYRTQFDAIPHLSEFFGLFNNGDRYFRQRKVWSIY